MYLQSVGSKLRDLKQHLLLANINNLAQDKIVQGSENNLNLHKFVIQLRL